MRHIFLGAIAVGSLALALAGASHAYAHDLGKLIPAGEDAFKFTVAWSEEDPFGGPASACCAGDHNNAVGHPTHLPGTIVHFYWTRWDFKGSWKRQAFDVGFVFHRNTYGGHNTYSKVGAPYYPGHSGSKPTSAPATGTRRAEFEYWGRKGDKTCKNGKDLIKAEAFLGGAGMTQTCAGGDYCMTRWPMLRVTSVSGGVLGWESSLSCTNGTAIFEVGDEWPAGRFAASTQPDIEFKTHILVEEDKQATVYCGGKGYTTPLRTEWRFYHDEGDCGSPGSGFVAVGGAVGSLGVTTPTESPTTQYDVFPPAIDLPVTSVRPEAAKCGTYCGN